MRRHHRHPLRFLVVLVVLAFFVRPLAAVAALLLVLALAHLFAEQVAVPSLRRRHIEREARRGLRSAVPGERRRRGEAHTRELGSLFASLADEIRDPLRAAQGLVRQMGDDPESAAHADCARLALGELDRVEESIAHLLRTARRSAAERMEGAA